MEIVDSARCKHALCVPTEFLERAGAVKSHYLLFFLTNATPPKKSRVKVAGPRRLNTTQRQLIAHKAGIGPDNWREIPEKIG